jgi:hypothetical protein
MLILFDHGTPRGLAGAFSEHTVITAQGRGWRRRRFRENASSSRECGLIEKRNHMSTLKQHAKSIAATATDYRKDELDEPFTPDHVLTWIDQLDAEDQLPTLAELDHVLQKTYFSEARVTKFLRGLVKTTKLTGEEPAKFWKSAGVLDIQQGGSSQTELLDRFNAVMQEQIGIDLQECEATSGNFIYLDDAIFTGNRVLYDLQPWIENEAPQKAKVYIVVLALHEGGDYYATGKLKEAAKRAGKTITTEMWSIRRIENRRTYKNKSEVLWPSKLPEGNDEIDAYVQMLKDAGYPPEKRAQGSTPKDGVFSGEAGRAALESSLLKAGVQVRSMCPNLKDTARPLGYSKLNTLGFGATVVTYRNCPNNCPLALWVSEPWYPLFRRKIN